MDYWVVTLGRWSVVGGVGHSGYAFGNYNLSLASHMSTLSLLLSFQAAVELSSFPSPHYHTLLR